MPFTTFRIACALIVISAHFVGTNASRADDIVIADFEGATYGKWIVEGTAFGPSPAQGALPGQMHVAGFKGKGLVNSFFEGDRSTGKLVSPEFKLERRYLQFLIGGGGWEGKTCMNLLVDGKIVRTATGPNTVSGGSEDLSLNGWDLADLAGKNAHIEIIDNETGGWGHINVDHIVLTDKKPPLPRLNVKHELVAESRWLNFPIKTGGPKRVVTLVLDGRSEPALEMELADQDVDWWAPRDISAIRGRKIEIIVDKLPEDSRVFEQLKQTETLVDSETLYREPLRPQLHFSPRHGWNNDPNGMVFFEGKYHLFFQHNPYGWNWGNMHWGHAVSRDMTHWEEVDETLFPDKFGPMFSGSGVVDWKNTSGFGKDGIPPIVLIYTAAGNPTVQCIAYSQDRGQTFVKYAQNPILGQITGGNRDPKVIFYEPTKKWVMTLYVEKDSVHTIQFFTSSNLKDWNYTSQVAGFFECPDFFPLAVDGDASQTKWVLTAASSEYVIGVFDGETFTPETGKLPGHRGRGFYAAQTFSDIPKSRRVQIGWLQAASPGMSFNQAMSLPLDLSLTKTPEGPRLRWRPVEELKSLRTKFPTIAKSEPSAKSPNRLKDISGELIEIDLDFKPDATLKLILTVRGIPITYDATRQEIVIHDHRAAAPLRDGRQHLTVFVDRTALEIFASDGLTYIPFPAIPKADDVSYSLKIEGGTADVTHLEVHKLKSIWSGK